MPNYLLEIGTEELPAESRSEAQEKLRTLIGDAAQSRLTAVWSRTPMGRQALAVFIRGLARSKDTINKRVKGPVKSVFMPREKPLPRQVAFRRSTGVKVEDLAREEMGALNIWGGSCYRGQAGLWTY